MHPDNILFILRTQYGLDGLLQPIYSELDAVYSLTNPQGKKYAVKLSHPGRPKAILDMETKALKHLRKVQFPYALPIQCLSVDGGPIAASQGYHIRVFEWIEKNILADIKPQSSATRHSIGQMLASITIGLREFEDAAAHRFIKWDPSQKDWIKDHLHLHPPHIHKVFTEKLAWIDQVIKPALLTCPKQINYNDANDYNLLCFWDPDSLVFKAHGFIDCLDMVYTHRINELAIACAYLILDLPDPLRGASEILSAYHEIQPLEDQELKVLYAQILSRLMISLTVSAINRRDYPDNSYLQITDKKALLLFDKWVSISPDLAHYTFRAVCNKKPVPGGDIIIEKLKKIRFHPLLDMGLLKSYHLFNFRIDSPDLGNFEAYSNDAALKGRLQQILITKGIRLGLGGYNEIRPFYTTDSFKSEGNDGPDWRTVHLGLDFFTEPGTPVFAPFKGIIHSFQDNANPRDYGPTLILKHETDGVQFFTLYGHLSRKSLELWEPGQTVSDGQTLSYIGDLDENGGWPPHLHFQVILDLMDMNGDFPGVAAYEDRNLWTSICPDPEILTGISSQVDTKSDLYQLQDARKNKLGYNLSLSYRQPLYIQRGVMQYLLDHTGRRFLDTVNNVAHCGHECPRIVRRGQAAMAVLNTNTRYLHPQIIELADQLTRMLDPSLSICYFTNSGTEANELAIRLAKNYTRQKDILTLQWAYHGNSALMIDLSSYKFDRKGGQGRPAHTHVIPMPDPFRGKYAGATDQAEAYMEEVQSILEQLQGQGKAPVGLFAESILSCGGQVVYPLGFLNRAVQSVRKSGGLYIADEVQTGLGRTGEYFCAYEKDRLVPDIVTFGKPLGNGHPIGAVVCRTEIAAAFNNGMEYFNTFGGNPVSCAIACEVLTTLIEEKLMDQANQIGSYLKNEWELMKFDHPILADIRGFGYFLGIEFMNGLQPATPQAKYFIERMKTKGILMSTDGPDDNVIKFKPPMCFDRNDADQLLQRSKEVLKENFMQV
ncbi:MAG: aminotransferase class III-fold pyridoxal phosphate-dependent enzyme [Saprospiraceae bacterium]|nr:aminotransferase class III-fold pyridoxal phosphate-dependent enzyme [Saprospiraceae bacterium]